MLIGFRTYWNVFYIFLEGFREALDMFFDHFELFSKGIERFRQYFERFSTRFLNNFEMVSIGLTVYDCFSKVFEINLRRF